MHPGPPHQRWWGHSRWHWLLLLVWTHEWFRLSSGSNASIWFHLTSCMMQTANLLMSWQIQWFTMWGMSSRGLCHSPVIHLHNVTVHNTFFQYHDSKVIMLNSLTPRWPHMTPLDQIQVYSSCLACGPHLKPIWYTSSSEDSLVILPILTSHGPPG